MVFSYFLVTNSKEFCENLHTTAVVEGARSEYRILFYEDIIVIDFIDFFQIWLPIHMSESLHTTVVESADEALYYEALVTNIIAVSHDIIDCAGLFQICPVIVVRF